MGSVTWDLFGIAYFGLSFIYFMQIKILQCEDFLQTRAKMN